VIVGIHPDHGQALTSFSKRYVDILEHNGIGVRVLSLDTPEFWEVIRGLDAYIYRFVHSPFEKQRASAILPVLERELALPVFPNDATAWHFDDKVRQHYLLTANGFPTIDTWVFWTRAAAQRWLDTAVLPVVFKVRSGAGAAGVALVHNRPQAERYLKRAFSSGFLGYWIPMSLQPVSYKEAYRRFRKQAGRLKMKWLDPVPYYEGAPEVQRNHVLFQQYLPGNSFDTRVNIIGNRAFAFRRHNRPGDFRASGSGNIDWDPAAIDLDAVTIAFQVSKRLGFQSMAYDFLYDLDGGLRICEISYTYKDWGVHTCPGYWDGDLNWHQGRYWPQFCQLQDLLGLPDLQQPASDE
jgi:glutathione synthase/RimK-type ligase-like ATP-grasp enzyme